MGRESRRNQGRKGDLTTVERMRSEVFPEGVEIVSSGKYPKISTSLSELLRPYVDDSTDIEEYRTLVNFGVIAWNLISEGDAESEQLVNRFIEEAESGASFGQFFEQLKERRARLFPHDRRVILSTEVHPRDDGRFYLVAAAARVAGQAAERG